MSPLIAIGPSLFENSRFITDVSTGVGWRSTGAPFRADDRDAIAPDIAAYIGHIGEDRAMATLRLRPGGDAVAIIAVDDRPAGAERPSGGVIDDIVPDPLTGAAIIALTRRWRPTPLQPATYRIAAELGTDAVWDLLARFRGMLAAALARPDCANDRGYAHRVAGIAGTLGFAEVGELWRGASNGTPPPEPLLRYKTRLAIGTIRRALPNRPTLLI